MHTVLLSILSPAEDSGNAFNHAPDSEVDVARRRACVAVSGALVLRPKCQGHINIRDGNVIEPFR